MKRQILLDGTQAYRVQSGTAYLYAMRMEQDAPTGRVYHYATAQQGELIAAVRPVTVAGDTWGCVVRPSGGAQLEPAQEECSPAAQANFTAFVENLENHHAEEIRQVAAHRTRDARAVGDAVARLQDINTRLVAWSDIDYINENELIEACTVLGKYLGVAIHVPTQEARRRSEDLTEDILNLSGIRSKKVSLAPSWWERDSGAMLGTLEDGTPVTLLPRGMRGYRMFNPRTDTTVRVTADIAQTIDTHATAVYRTFPEKPIGVRQILKFALGEHIGSEIVTILLFTFLASLIQVLPPIISQQIFDVIVPERLYGMLLEVILILLSFQIASMGFSIVVNLGFSRIKTKIEVSVQAAIWDRLLSMRLPFFYQFTAGELLEKIKGIDKVKQTLSLKLLETFLSSIFALINIYVLFRYIPSITPTVLLMFLLCFVVSWYIGMRKYRLNQRYIAVSNRLTSLNHQMLDGMQRIKSSRAEARVFSMWSKQEAEARFFKGRMKMMDNALDAFYTFFKFGAIAVVYLLISRQTNVEMGVFVAYISSFLIVQATVMNLLGVLNVLPELVPVMQNIKPILQSPPAERSTQDVPDQPDGTLSVHHASFQYDPYGQTILHDISISVAQGESIGIIGFSGSGKSTLLKLLLGLYPPTEGKVYMGGYDMATVDTSYLRQRAGVVMQNGRITVGSVYTNVIGNDSRITEEEAMEALNAAGLGDYVRALPKGIHSAVGTGTTELSEGQKQQLLIARALVRKPSYIFFDEATSQLDAITQASVMAQLHTVRATKVIVAQNLSTVEACDRILVMDQGKIIIQGTYAELAAKGIMRPLGTDA